MCREMSQYMPNTAVRSELPRKAAGSEDHPATPVSRSAKLASLPTHLMRPLRCEMQIHSRIAVATAAPPVAIATWSRPEPPAGGWLAAEATGAATSAPRRAAAVAKIVLRARLLSGMAPLQ